MAELAAILAKRRSITDASTETAVAQGKEREDARKRSTSWYSTEKTPERKSKRLPPPPRRPSGSRTNVKTSKIMSFSPLMAAAKPSSENDSEKQGINKPAEEPQGAQALPRDSSPPVASAANSESSSSIGMDNADLPQRRNSPSMSLSEVGDYIKDRRISESFIEELVDDGEVLKRRRSIESIEDVQMSQTSSESSNAFSSEAMPSRKQSSEEFESLGLLNDDDNLQIDALIDAESGEDDDSLTFGTPPTGKKMKATWDLYRGGHDDGMDDILYRSSGEQSQTEYSKEQHGSPLAIRLRARNKALERRVKLLEKELSTVKAELAALKSVKPDVPCQTDSVVPDLKTAETSTNKHVGHSRHTSMPDPLGIDNDVVEKPIDISRGRSSSLSRGTSLDQKDDIDEAANLSSGSRGLVSKTKSGRDMLLSDSPQRGSTSSDPQVENGQMSLNDQSRGRGSDNLFEEIDRDAERERQLMQNIHGSSDDDSSGDQVSVAGANMVEAPSVTYRASEAKRSRGYRRFLDNFRKREAIDLLTDIKRFVTSVLMPHKNVYGKLGGGRQDDSLEERSSQWFAYMDTRFRNHSIWEEASEEEVEEAREHLEKYVMLKLYKVAFQKCVTNTQARDIWFEKRMLVLRKVLTADHLDVNPSCRSSMTLELASSELEKVNSYRAPVDKAHCVVRCCSFLFNQLSVNRNDKNARPGADDFLPVFIYVVLHSSVPRLHANINYISSYRNPQALMSKAGYCLVNLQSALAFLSNVRADSLTGISQAEFEDLCRKVEADIGTGDTSVAPRDEET